MTGQNETWEAWLAQHGPAALLYARHLSSEFADAQDAVHDGFLRFWTRRHETDDPVAFFFACIRTAALDRVRRDRRRGKREIKHARDALLIAGSDETGEEQARGEIIERALLDLPAEQREVVVLKLWGGLTFQQIAASLNASPNTIAARYRYALEKLSRSLAQEKSHDR